MSEPVSADSQPSQFSQMMNGMLFSLLSWQQLAEFWQRLDRDGGWYLYAIGEPLPSEPKRCRAGGEVHP